MIAKTNRSPMMRVACAMLIACLLMSCTVFGTMANYISTANGSDTTSVAKWEFHVGTTNIAQSTTQTFTFDLFNTINEADTEATEDSVKAGLIAPGTGGSFVLDVKNLSEVDAKYTLELTETNASNVPIQYSLDKTTWKDDMSAINTAHVDEAIAKTNGATSITVYWRWCFDGTDTGAHAGQTDASDTALGIAGQTSAPAVTVKANVTAEQVN